MEIFFRSGCRGYLKNPVTSNEWTPVSCVRDFGLSCRLDSAAGPVLPGRGVGVFNPHAIEEIANRIERAYSRRQPYWRGGWSNSRVWAAAAVALVRMHKSDPRIPLDPELYVASQMAASPLADPWVDLAQARSALRYRRSVKDIIRKLRGELHAEIRRVEDRVSHGEAIECVLLSRCRVLSPLGRYIAAQRAGRPDLAERFRLRAQDQHRACPLYRHACKRLIAREAYPVLELVSALGVSSRAAEPSPQFSLN
jgi:hypothetical protein